MQFISRENTREILEINKDCSSIFLEGVEQKVTSISFFNERSGKFETKNYKIKYSNKTLYLYDTYFKLLKEFTQVTDNTLIEAITTASQNIKFALKKDTFVELKITNDKKYINEEEVISENKLGLYYTVYKTLANTELHFSRNTIKFPHKYNGIPIAIA